MLIDTEDFKHRINNSDLYGTEAWDKVMNMLAECESFNIVHCKDCEHFMEFEKPLGKWQGLCHYYNAHSVMKNDFCSRGKQK